MSRGAAILRVNSLGLDMAPMTRKLAQIGRVIGVVIRAMGKSTKGRGKVTSFTDIQVARSTLIAADRSGLTQERSTRLLFDAQWMHSVNN